MHKYLKFSLVILLMSVLFISINAKGCLWWRDKDDDDVVVVTGSSGTPPAQVTSPNPVNTATDIPITQQLDWAAASGATSYDVYFHPDIPPSIPKTNTSETSYHPGSLKYITTYYWRIDSKNEAGTTAGNVWSFQTIQPWTEKIADGDGDSPSQRSWHPLVWDGTQALVFGGYGELGVVQNDLWWYAPITNTWTEKIATNDPGSPSKRRECSMVWAETKAIMFGGWISGVGRSNDLWWYYPITNTWIDMTPVAISPTARQDHSMVWDGTRVILFSGLGGGNDLWWYDPGNNEWTEKITDGDPGSPPSRSRHSMVWDGTRVILFSGLTGGGRKNDLWWYDPGNNEWTEKIADGDPDSPSPREWSSMVWDGTRVILFAGIAGASNYNDLWWYDPGNNEWTEKISHGKPGLPMARNSHSMVWDGIRVIMFGGIGYDSNNKNDLWWYEP